MVELDQVNIVDQGNADLLLKAAGEVVRIITEFTGKCGDGKRFGAVIIDENQQLFNAVTIGDLPIGITKLGKKHL